MPLTIVRQACWRRWLIFVRLLFYDVFPAADGSSDAMLARYIRHGELFVENAAAALL
jgi:hypothetical protein